MTALVLILFTGEIKSFLVEPIAREGYQVEPVVAVASNGNFAVAWEDSLLSEGGIYMAEVYIRFFDRDGNILTESMKLNEDTTGCWPRLAVDGSGNFMCVWGEAKNPIIFGLRTIYGRVFDSTGTPVSERFSVTTDSTFRRYGYDVGGFSEGFYVAWASIEVLSHEGFFGRRYSNTGVGIGDSITIYCDSIHGLNARHPAVGTNASGTAAVAWEWNTAFISFQVVDPDDNLAEPDSFIHFTNTWNVPIIGTPDIRWVNDNRFSLFCLKDNINPDTINGVQAKLFTADGDSVSGVKTVYQDRYVSTSYHHTPLSVSSFHNGQCAVACKRGWDIVGSRRYQVIGFLANESLEKTTGIFPLQPYERHYYQEEKQPSVDACDDRIVWVWMDNSFRRECPDERVPYYHDVHCLITDWDIVGIEEQPASRPTNWEIGSAVGSEIVLRYHDCPGGFHAAIYDVTGCKIDEVHNANASGTITWPVTPATHQFSPGVYFIKPVTGNAPATKVVLVR